MTKEHKAIRDALDAAAYQMEFLPKKMEIINKAYEALDSIMAGVPDGYVIVPIAPTREMYEHGVMAKDVMFTTGAGLNTSYFPVGAIYQAMLSAAPKHGGE